MINICNDCGYVGSGPCKKDYIPEIDEAKIRFYEKLLNIAKEFSGSESELKIDLLDSDTTNFIMKQLLLNQKEREVNAAKTDFLNEVKVYVDQLKRERVEIEFDEKLNPVVSDKSKCPNYCRTGDEDTKGTGVSI
ncbi:MAG: hypothetical protein V3U72_02195 [Candidatus Aenigmarchaeota archaeon]